jgi:hypothetical protein
MVVLRAHAPAAIADGFCAARIAMPGLAYGAAGGLDTAAILHRAAVIPNG